MSASSLLSSRLSAALSRLSSGGQKIAVAETSAGGLIAAGLLAQPGASKYFAGGVVTYTKESKLKLLGLDSEKTKPTSTEPHAFELAMAVRTTLGSDWAIGETGVAGPSPNSRGIAPGVGAIAVVGPNNARLTKSIFPDDELSASDAYGQARKVPRDEQMQIFMDEALELLCDLVEREGPGE